MAGPWFGSSSRFFGLAIQGHATGPQLTTKTNAYSAENWTVAQVQLISSLLAVGCLFRVSAHGGFIVLAKRRHCPFSVWSCSSRRVSSGGANRSYEQLQHSYMQVASWEPRARLIVGGHSGLDFLLFSFFLLLLSVFPISLRLNITFV